MVETIPTEDVQAVRGELWTLLQNIPPSEMWDKLDVIDSKLVHLIVKSRSIDPQTGEPIYPETSGDDVIS